MGIEIKFYNLDTFKKQVDANCIELDSEFVDLNYKVASLIVLIFCHFWRSIEAISSGFEGGSFSSNQIASKFVDSKSGR